MNDDDPTWISDEQVIAGHVLRICSASLSVLGSGTLVFKIVRDRTKSAGCMTPYHRIILGLSACDILLSIIQAILGFLYPSGWHVGAFGNAATCRALGFLTQLSVSAVWYNGLLSFYFLLTVLSQVRQKNYVRKAEPWLHLTVLYWPITAIVGISLGWFGEGSSVCWWEDEILAWTLAGIPVLFLYLCIIVNYTAIYLIVRKSLRMSQHVAGSETVPKRIEKETTTLMIMYVVGFVICITPTIVLAVLEDFFGYNRGDSKVYPLLVLASIFVPLQGFFNVFIYIKPVYARFRAAYPKESRRFVLKQAILKCKAPSLQHRRVANNITDRSDVLITDVTLLPNREMDPNVALFYPGVPPLPSSGDPSNQPDSANREGRNPIDPTTSDGAAVTLDGATNTP